MAKLYHRFLLITRFAEARNGYCRGYCLYFSFCRVLMTFASLDAKVISTIQKPEDDEKLLIVLYNFRLQTHHQTNWKNMLLHTKWHLTISDFITMQNNKHMSPVGLTCNVTMTPKYLSYIIMILGCYLFGWVTACDYIENSKWVLHTRITITI